MRSRHASADAASLDDRHNRPLGRLARPCRVVWGDRDQFIPVKFAHGLGVKQITIVPDAGHWVALTAPEALALAVEALGWWLESDTWCPRRDATGDRRRAHARWQTFQTSLEVDCRPSYAACLGQNCTVEDADRS